MRIMKTDKYIQIFQIHINLFLHYLSLFFTIFGATSFSKFFGSRLHGKLLCMGFGKVFGNNSCKEVREAGLDRGRGSSMSCYNGDPRLSQELLTQLSLQNCPKSRHESWSLFVNIDQSLGTNYSWGGDVPQVRQFLSAKANTRRWPQL